MKNVRLIFFICLFTNLTIQAKEIKSNCGQGYIVPNVDSKRLGSDTLFGEICTVKNKMGAEFYKIKFTSANNDPIKIEASEIQLFQKDIYYYESFFLDEHTSFAKREVHGKINLFSHVETVATSSSNTSGKVSYYIQSPKSNKFILIPIWNKKFVKVLSEYISDNKELMTLVINKELRSSDIIEIIKRYNSY
jgi:hypothetical protein